METTGVRRRWGIGVGIALAIAVVVALLAWLSNSMIERAWIVSYSSAGNELTVIYAPAGSCDTVLRTRATETDTAVDIVIVAVGPPPFVPTNASQDECVVTFELDAPLGGRLVTGRGLTP
ncbi:hypothetical protein [Demequina sp. NBRC 110055]|uniref:hypothetical protein n=1 Tax=Demequina sp. NBRC 110055 TaxID=1570344 RepID=UPI000A06681E|nr:hypothetical protein [Demequina sp. NBRC 110055]